MDIQKAIFDAFTQSITRFRWFILTCILIATILLTHVNLETGFTMTQLKGFALEQRISNTEAALLARTAAIREKYNQGATTDTLAKDPVAVGLAEEWQVFQRHKNMLESHAVVDRELPILGYHVPGNDFVPVMAMLLFVFSVASWLSSRSVLASIEHIKPFATKQLMGLFRLHFMFTVPVEGKHGMANLVQFLAVWIPTFVFALAAILDMVPAFAKYNENPGMLTLPFAPLLLRLVLLFALFAGVLACAVATTFTVARINESTDAEHTVADVPMALDAPS